MKSPAHYMSAGFCGVKRVRELNARAAGRSKFKVAHTLRKTGLSFNCLRLIAKATIVALANWAGGKSQKLW